MFKQVGCTPIYLNQTNIKCINTSDFCVPHVNLEWHGMTQSRDYLIWKCPNYVATLDCSVASKQVTSSRCPGAASSAFRRLKDGELFPRFSPDCKYIAMCGILKLSLTSSGSLWYGENMPKATRKHLRSPSLETKTTIQTIKSWNMLGMILQQPPASFNSEITVMVSCAPRSPSIYNMHDQDML